MDLKDNHTNLLDLTRKSPIHEIYLAGPNRGAPYTIVHNNYLTSIRIGYIYIDKSHVMQIRVPVPFLSNMAESGIHTESSKIRARY